MNVPNCASLDLWSLIRLQEVVPLSTTIDDRTAPDKTSVTLAHIVYRRPTLYC